MRYGMAINTKRCIGCHTCSVKCKMENNVPNGLWWNQTRTVGGEAMDTPSGNFPNTEMSYLTISCMHCENPACTKVCPVGATYKDPETGIVRQDADKCIGCRMCMAACPYTGVRSFNWDEPAFHIDVTTGGAAVPAHQKHTVEKCTLCYHRTSQGKAPACSEVCPARARVFGDLDDPDSEVSRLIREEGYEQLLPHEGTDPSLFYLM